MEEMVEITKKEYKELISYKRDYEALRDEINTLYVLLSGCDISRGKDDIEEI